MPGHRISPTDLDRLASNLAGSVVLPDDVGYDAARSVWNAMVDKHPAAIVRAGDVSDVVPSLAFARKHGLPLAVRGGGHNVAGNGTVEAGLVLDLGACRAVGVDPGTRTVTVEPGATLSDLDAATDIHRLAVPVGVVSATGVAGLTLGGGFGWLTRRHGLTVDNLMAADLITADGGAVRASSDVNPELLWGLKGGGGNFGIVTSFTFAAQPMPETVFSGNLIYERRHWVAALRAFAAWTRTVPDDMTTIITALAPPPEWELGTDPVLVIGFVWSDADHPAGEACLAALLRQAPPDAQEIGPAVWPEWQSSMDALFPKGVRAYWKNSGFGGLDDEVIDILVARAAEQTWQGTAFDIHHMGGAFGRVDPDATAFPDRSPEFWINIYGFWNETADDRRNIAFVRGLAGDMDRFSHGAQYVNFLAGEPDGAPAGDAWSRARAVYGEAKLRRLSALKRKYDPENVFRLNHNIPPAPDPT